MISRPVKSLTVSAVLSGVSATYKVKPKWKRYAVNLESFSQALRANGTAAAR